MIARFRILLPFALSLPEGLVLEDLEIDSSPYRILVHAPVQSLIATTKKLGDLNVPLIDVGHELVQANPQQPTDSIKLNGRRTLQADLLEIDFQKDYFDRDTRQHPQSIEPTAQAAFEIANSLLRRLRSVGQMPRISTLEPASTLWMIEYLTDVG